jgi:hypothetical protein
VGAEPHGTVDAARQANPVLEVWAIYEICLGITGADRVATEAAAVKAQKNFARRKGEPMNTGDTEDDRMTSAERSDLAKVVRIRAKVVRRDIDQQEAQQLAEMEQQLAATYAFDHDAWAKLTKHAQDGVRKADAEIAELCRKMGIPEAFRPQLSLRWYDRGENAIKDRRAELRKVAERTLAARAETAKVKVDRAEADLLTQITIRGLRSAEAKAFLESLPTIDQLMPKLPISEIEKRLPLPKAEGPDMDD